MRAGAVSELQSVMFPVEVNILANHQKIIKNNEGVAQVSAEMFVNAEVAYMSNVGGIKQETKTVSLAL